MEQKRTEDAALSTIQMMDAEADVFIEETANRIAKWVELGADAVFIRSVFQRLEERVSSKL